MKGKHKQQDEVQEFLEQQKSLVELREKVSKFLKKRIFVICGDPASRDTIKSYLDILGFSPDKIRTSNTSAAVISQIKKNPENIDLIICNLKVLDGSVSTKTGLQLLHIVKNMLLTAGSEKLVPFIFVEKVFDRQIIISACKAGASQFLILPSDPVSFGQKLMEVLEKPEESLLHREVSRLLVEGNMLQEMGLFDQAIIFYNRALKMGGENSAVLAEKANTLLKMNEVDQAIRIFKQITEFEANFPRAYQGMGKAYEQLGNYKEAKKNYLKVMDLEPDNVQVLYHIGALYQDEGDFEKAGFYFREGIERNKKFVKNYLGLAKVFEARDNPKKALEIYRKALEYNPTQNFLYLLMGDFCLKYNLDAEAEGIFGEAIALNENHTHLYNKMGIALRRQEKFDQAIENFLKAMKIKPDDANLHYNLAKAYYVKGEEQPAIEELNRAVDLDPTLRLKLEKDQYFSKLIKKISIARHGRDA